MSKGFVASGKDGAILDLRVSFGAGRTSIGGHYGEHALKTRVAAPPVVGEANVEAERFLAGVPGAPT